MIADFRPLVLTAQVQVTVLGSDEGPADAEVERLAELIVQEHDSGQLSRTVTMAVGIDSFGGTLGTGNTYTGITGRIQSGRNGGNWSGNGARRFQGSLVICVDQIAADRAIRHPSDAVRTGSLGSFLAGPT